MSEEVSSDQFEKVLMVLGASLLIISVVLAGPAASFLGMVGDEDTEQTPTEIDVQGAKTAETPDSTQKPPTLTPEPGRSEDMTNRELLDYYVKGLDDEGTVDVIDYTVADDYVWLEYQHDYDNEYEQQLHAAAWYSVFVAEVLSNDEPWDKQSIQMVSFDDGDMVSAYEIRTVYAISYYQEEITADEYMNHVRSSLIYQTDTPTPTERPKTTDSPTPAQEDGFEFPGDDTPTPTEEPTPTAAPTPTQTDSTPTPAPDGTTPTPDPSPTPTQTPNGTTPTPDSTPTPTPTPDGTSTATPTPTSTKA